jgi:uncharacterized protein YxeA
MKKNLLIIFFVLLAIILCIYFFNAGVDEARAYKHEAASGQGK